MTDPTKDFEIASVSRRDLQSLGLSVQEVDSLSDADMEEIAQEMAHLYIDHAFWQDLKFVVRCFLAERKNPHGSSQISMERLRRQHEA